MPTDIIQTVYRLMLDTYGKQGWWPSKTRFETLVGAVLVQNTAWANVESALRNLRDNDALDPETILATPTSALKRWIRPSGYYNVKCGRLVALCHWAVDHGGVEGLNKQRTSALRQSLLGVHGVGPETADAILLYGFERPVFVIDAYTRRIFKRIGLIDGSEHYETLRLLFESAMPNTKRAGVRANNEYHALIVRHAKQMCRKMPKCRQCTLNSLCHNKNE